MITKDIAYQIDGKTYTGYLADGSSGHKRPGILVCHQGNGLADHAKQRARMLAELESEEWLVRAPHESDGRQSLLSLTPQGRKRLADAAKASDAALAKIVEATLSVEERRLLLRACELLDGLDEALGRSRDTLAEPVPAK